MKDNTNMDAAIAYYMFINHGTLPHVIAEMDCREKAFIFAMIDQEVKSRKK